MSGISLVERTREMLVNRPKPVTLQIISTQCDCSIRFLTMLATDVDRDFGVLRVQRVHDFLATYAR